MEINFLDLLPIAVIVITFGFTWTIRKLVLKPDGSYPNWLILVPLVTGLVLGTIDYYLKVDPKVLLEGAVWRTLLAALFQGFTYAGAAVLLWELRKKYLPMPDEKS